MAELNANDKMLLECIRGEFNNQEQDERIRVADFMDYEAVTELLRERQHAEAAVQRIGRRIAAILEYAGKRRARGVTVAPAPWSVKVHCSKGERELRAGLRFRDGLHGSTWEVVEPDGGRIYSPSGFGGTPTFWCRPVGVLPAGPEHLMEGQRADGCVSFCGDSVAAGLIGTDGVGASDSETLRTRENHDR